jgi:hypothetical protein
MDTEKANNVQLTLAQLISYLFHPLLIPAYGLLIIFIAPTLFRYIPLRVKELLFLIVLINNILIPVTLVPFFRYRNLISSWRFTTRNERSIPLFIIALLYFITSFIMFGLQIPVFFKAYSYSLSTIILILFIVNMWWKISLYSAGAGVLTGLILALSLKMTAAIPLLFVSILLASGLVLSSRLKLNRHSPLQVYTGFFTGFAIVTIYILVFK